MRPTLILVCAALFLSPDTGLGAGQVQRSVFKIFTTQSPPNVFRPWEVTPPTEATGTGVLIEGGRILTNAHVVAHAQQIYVQPYESSDRLDAVAEFVSEDCDLATLRLEDPDAIKDLQPIPLATDLPAPKSKVSVLGYPTGGDTLSITEGVVSRIEYVPYSYDSAALRIQVDAAINPGNSGGPGLVDDQIAGIVFSRFTEGENIGYLIPAEVVRHFLDDWTKDNKYDGFPKIGIDGATLENPALRAYLKLEREHTGFVVHRIDRDEIGTLIRPWDVIMECDGVSIDNLGMVPVKEGVRVSWAYLVSRKEPGSKVRLKIRREGRDEEVEIPTVTTRNTIIQRMAGPRPTYFIYGGLVFSPATTELCYAAAKYFAVLGFSGRMLPSFMNKMRDEPGDQVVLTTTQILPHRLTKGYGVSPLSVVTHVNDQPIKNLRHMIELIRDNKEPYVIFRFENEFEEKIVLEPAQVEKYTPEILRANNIPAVCSEDLRDIWPAAGR
jgi:S1-C subfamily serine protease